jgi:hypothetical protein
VGESSVNKGNVQQVWQFLGTFAKLREVTVSFIMSIYLPICMEQLGLHWTNFHEI